MSANVDPDHTVDCITGRYRTGCIMFLKNSPIYWFTKKQGGIETSSFGSKFIAMTQCTDNIRGLRDNLRMMVIPVDGPPFIFVDNK